jgi:hypothetical protein
VVFLFFVFRLSKENMNVISRQCHDTFSFSDHWLHKATQGPTSHSA